jgi:hypothetical protein
MRSSNLESIRRGRLDGMHFAADASMVKRFAAFAVIPAVFFAGGLALYGVERIPGATAATTHAMQAPLAPIGETRPPENGQSLPPDHPPIGTAASPYGSLPSAATDAPALVWKMPAAWQEAVNPNAMRLATYHAPGGVEVAVSRAGGSTEANIQRWIAQFDGVGHDGRTERTVRGLHVVTVEVAGTYAGGGMAMGAPAEPKPDWAMVGSIVETRSPSYFFKMTGPAAAVRAARPVFDRFIDGVTPT